MNPLSTQPHKDAMDWRLPGVLALLYFAQGLPSGLLAKALPSMLREQGMSLPAIGLTGLLALPWALKFLWAPFLDRLDHARRALIVLTATTLFLMGCLAARPFGFWIDQAFVPMLLLLALLNLVAATQDIVTDGLAVRRLPLRWRGLGNSVQVIGYKVGMIAGGGGMLWIVATMGWQSGYLLVSLFLLPVLFAVFLLPDRPAPGSGPSERPLAWQGAAGYAGLFRRFVSRPGMGWWLAAVALFKVGDSLASRMIGPLLTDQGLPLANVGLLVGVTGSLAGMAGALLGGLLLTRIGHRNALLLFGSLQALGLAAYLLVAGGTGGIVVQYLVVCAEQFADGLSTVALFTLMMDACRRESAGTDYTLQASLQLSVTGVAALASGFIAEAAGYEVLFLSGALLTLGALIPVWMYFRVAFTDSTGRMRHTATRHTAKMKRND